MAQELVLDAAVADKFSKPMKDLIARLKDVKPSEGLRQTAKQFEQLRNQVEAAGKSIREGIGGLASGAGLAGLSVGALSAAGAMAALGASVRSFADNAVRIREFSAATGIAGQKLKELQAISSGLGINPDAVAGMLSFSASNADKMRRGQGNYSAIANLGQGGRSIADDLKNTKSNDEVVEKELRYIQQQKTAEQKRTLGLLFFGDESAAAFGIESPAKLEKRRAAARASIGNQSKQDEENAERFLDAVSNVSNALERMKNAVGGALAPDLTAAADGLAAFTDAHLGDIKEFFEKVTTALKNEDWSADMKGVESFFTSIKNFADWLADKKKTFDHVGDAYRSLTNGDSDKLERAGKDIIRDIVPKGVIQSGPSRTPTGAQGTQAAPDPNAGGNTQSPGVPNNGDDVLKGSRYDDGGLYHRMAYRPGERSPLNPGAIGARDAIQTIAAGVTKGMQDFAQSMQGGGADTGVGDVGFQNASWSPGGGRSAFGGGGQGGSTNLGSLAPLSKEQLKGTSAEMVAYIRQAAIDRGIDPEIALRVARSEGGLSNPYRHGEGPAPRGQDPRLGSKENSYGPFQLWVSGRGNGLGDRAVRAGSDPRTNWKAGVDYALDEVRRKGWGQWYGAKHQGITGMRGVGPLPPRKSASDTAAEKAAKTSAAAGAQGPHGKVDVTVKSKDHPVDVRTNDSPVFREIKINRGNRMEI